MLASAVPAADGADGDADAEMSKLSAAELWSMLSHGAEQVFDPTTDACAPATAAEYDALIDGARPTSLQDEINERIDSGEAAAEAAAASASVGYSEAAPPSLAVASDGDAPTARAAARSRAPSASDGPSAAAKPAQASSVIELSSGDDNDGDDDDDDGGGAGGSKWDPPPTSRSHGDLLEALRVHMAAFALSQKALGVRIGSSQGVLSNWLRDTLPPPAQRRVDARVAAYLEDPEGVAALHESRDASGPSAAGTTTGAAAAPSTAVRGGTKRATAVPKRFTPPAARAAPRAKVRLRHDDYCFSCNDGGDLLECTVCPKVYHLECAGLDAVPAGKWHCPWHTCLECQRKSSNVGGQLFHCMTCPLSELNLAHPVPGRVHTLGYWRLASASPFAIPSPGLFTWPPPLHSMHSVLCHARRVPMLAASPHLHTTLS